MDKHFINLTNGLEALSSLEGKDVSYCYIASTTLERHNYIKLFSDLDHNFLFNLAIGNNCYFYDYGTNRPYSKTCYFGIPLIVYILTRFWLDRNEDKLCYRLDRRGLNSFPEIQKYNDIYTYLFLVNSTKEKEFIKTKLRKYKKFLITNEIKLTAISQSTTHDGDYSYYKSIIENDLLSRGT